VSKPASDQAPAVQMAPTTIFLCPDDEYEVKIAQEYVGERYPGTQAPVLCAVPVDKLMPHHTLVLVYRPRPCSEAVKTVRHTNGSESLEYRAPKALIDEVYESQPIAIKPMWASQARGATGPIASAFEMVSGSVDTRRLLSEVSAWLQDPYAVHRWRADDRILRIGV
jgi:hypothetical protein